MNVMGVMNIEEFMRVALRVGCGVGVISGVSECCIWIVKQAEGMEQKCVKGSKRLQILYSLSVALLLCFLPEADIFDSLLLEVLAGALLFACITDVMCCEAYQFTWWIAGSACILLWVSRGISVISVQALAFLCYLLLQELVFHRFYGRADCHAFAVCAAAGCALSMDMSWYFLHMTISFLLLTALQAFRRNIGRGGRLKRPVAFIPYIVVSFWMELILFTVL